MKNTLLNLETRKIAVIELSSTALKFLLGNDSFDISHITTQSFKKIPAFKIEPNMYVDIHGMVDTEQIEKNIIQPIHNFIETLVSEKVTEIYCFASCGFVQFDNDTRHILNYIHKETDLTFSVLSGKEEATDSYLSTKYILAGDLSEKNFLMNIDIGGKTTDITYRESNSHLGSQSFHVGTEIIDEIYSDCSQSNVVYGMAIHCLTKQTYEKVLSLVDTFFEELIDLSVDDKSFVVLVGSKIKELTKKNHFKKDKLYVKIDLKDLEDLIYKMKKNLEKDISNTEDILPKLKTHHKKRAEFYLVLRIYTEIINIYNIKTMYVSRGGLRHGVYFDQVMNGK